MLTAKRVASLDVLSGGRVTLGVGVGWLKEEFEALDSPEFERRVNRALPKGITLRELCEGTATLL